MKSNRKQNKVLKARGMQTVYREGDTQTDPWVPQHKVAEGRPEVFTLGFMKYGRDLPAWRRTVDTIEFIRKRRKWDRYLRQIYSPENAEYCKRIMNDIQMCELELIEKDYNRRNVERMELAAKNAEYLNFAFDERFKERQEFVDAQIADRNYIRLRSIKARKTRELRKIDMRQRGVNMKYRKLTPIEEMCDPLSPYTVSVARFGKNPRYGTKVLSKECNIASVNAYRTVEKILNEKRVEPIYRQRPSHKKHDCSRVHIEEIPVDEFKVQLENIEKAEYLPKSPRGMLVSQEWCSSDLTKVTPVFLTPRQEKDYQAVLLLQTLIRGRAVQNLMYKGRMKNQDLLDEILSTTPFFLEEQNEIDMRKRMALQQLRYYHLNMKHIGLVAQVREDIMTTGLNNLTSEACQEVERAAEEARAHLVVQTAERTRWRREAAESGRRQRELRRRELYDEFFRHLTRRNEITSDFYIKLIEEKVVRLIAEKEADISAKKKADEIEAQDVEDAMKKKHDIVARREMMAKLLHDIYLPYVSRERHDHEYLIDKARKTAIGVITGTAKRYGVQRKKTELLEPVRKLQKEEVRSETLSSSSSDSSYENLPDLSILQKSRSVIIKPTADLASTLSSKILSKMRSQEEAHALKKSEKEECLEGIYKFDPNLLADEPVTTHHRISAEDLEKEAELFPEGDLYDSESSTMSDPSDFIDQRLLEKPRRASSVSPEKSETDSCQEKLGDMPDRIADELLGQAEVLRHQDMVRADLVKLTMMREIDEESTSTQPESLELEEEGEYETEEEAIAEERQVPGEGIELNDDELFLREMGQRLMSADQDDPTTEEWIRRTIEQSDKENTATATGSVNEEESSMEEWSDIE